MKTLLFEAFDTLFFRDARPMESIGARPPAGRFPPQARTVVGAVRGWVGGAMGVDWPAYRAEDASQQNVADVIGKAKAAGIGKLKLTGPYPTLDGERLYPMPLCCLAKKQNVAALKPLTQPSPLEQNILSEQKEPLYDWERLTLGKQPVQCDLGQVYLPQTSGGLCGAKPLENAWLCRDDLQRVLAGEPPEQPIGAAQLFAAEGRLGIGIDPARRSVIESLLYQTVHARPLENVAVGVDVDGLPTTGLDLTKALVRFGGEGRFAGVKVDEGKPCPQGLAVKPRKGWNGVLLMLLTPACFDEPADSPHPPGTGACVHSLAQRARREQEGCWHPPCFTEQTDTQGVKVWLGEIEGVELTLLSAVIGKAVREGGWDLANHRSRPACNLIPAGSVFFCTVKGDASRAVEALQGIKIGYETELGRGELAAGYWEGIQK